MGVRGRTAREGHGRASPNYVATKSVPVKKIQVEVDLQLRKGVVQVRFLCEGDTWVREGSMRVDRTAGVTFEQRRWTTSATQGA